MSKKTESTFEKDDFVVYPTHGVGRILGTESRDVGGSTLEMLVVRFEHDRMTLRVPLEKARSLGLRLRRRRRTAKDEEEEDTEEDQAEGRRKKKKRR